MCFRHILCTMSIAVSLAMATSAPAYSDAAPPLVELDIEYDKFTLENGLRVIVHTDRKAPIVNVNVVYHVGSKDEPEGRTGFAHLFEHLLFNGSEHYDGPFGAPLSEVGAVDINGNTNVDRTNYFETVPIPALERTLWLESDRMAYLMGAMTQRKLDEQRGVVQNENRQRTSAPYADSEPFKRAGLYPPGHPYRHETIGLIEDLESATLEDVKDWYESYYGASNAILVLAGDIDLKTARPLVEKYFNEVPAGPPLQRRERWVPELAHNKIDVMQSNVPAIRITRTWTIPGRGERDATLLSLAANTLGGGRSSPLYRQLVNEAAVATRVFAAVRTDELAGTFEITVTVKDRGDVDAVNQLLDEIIANYLIDGPDSETLRANQQRSFINRVRAFERVGIKAVTLSEGEYATGNPGLFKQELNWSTTATAGDVHDVINRWLARPYYQMTVYPHRDHDVDTVPVDRSRMPDVGQIADLTFPEIQQAHLDNGMRVILAERHAAPLIHVGLDIRAGDTTAPAGKDGLPALVLELMGQGTRLHDRAQLQAEMTRLGIDISLYTSIENASTQFSVLAPDVGPAVALMAEMVRDPALDEDDFESQKAVVVRNASRFNPDGFSFAAQLFGSQHPYGRSEKGNAESMAAITFTDVQTFHHDYIRPGTTTILVAGDTTLETILPVLNQAFGDWVVDGPLPARIEVPVVELPARARVFMFHNPGAAQTSILAGQVIMPVSDSGALAVEVANNFLGGSFSSRLNTNLREEKGWTFGISTGAGGRVAPPRSGQRPWTLRTSVQTDKTVESIQEILGEIASFLSDEPVTEKDFDEFVRSRISILAARFEGSITVLGAMKRAFGEGKPLDDVVHTPEYLRALTVDEVNSVARETLRPAQFVWVIRGDLDIIEAGIRELDLGDIEIFR